MNELEDLERENEQLKKETVDLAKEVAINSWGCLWSVALLLFSMALDGFVAMKLWNGLIAPTFDLVTLSYWQAFGLDVFVSFLTAKIGNKNDGYENNQRAYLAIMSTLLFWGIGSIAMMFI